MARKPTAVMDTIRGMIRTRLGRADLKLESMPGRLTLLGANPQPLEIAHAKYEARA